MSDVNEKPHAQFVDLAREFKDALHNAGCFTRDEIAAMLGSFVLAVYQQQLATFTSPDAAEYMAKNTVLAERLLEELRRDE